ncbi:helicase SRCAP-like [Channa argus]|uniref:helicase SRCAP-like n=1 Tax=Channa argus TaxID=215402 RepID=UPI0035220C60
MLSFSPSPLCFVWVCLRGGLSHRWSAQIGPFKFVVATGLDRMERLVPYIGVTVAQEGPAAVPVLLSVSAVASPAPDSGPAPRLVSAPPGPESDPALAPSSGSLDALSGLDSDPDPAPASWSLTTSPSLDPSSVPVPGSGSAVVRPCSVPAPGSWLQVCCGLVSTLVLFLLLAPGRPWSGSVPAPGSGSVVVRPGSFPVPCSGLAVVGPGSVPAPGSWLWVCCGLASTLVLFLLLAPVRLRSGPFLNLLQAPGRLTLLLVHLLVLHYRDPV